MANQNPWALYDNNALKMKIIVILYYQFNNMAKYQRGKVQTDNHTKTLESNPSESDNFLEFDCWLEKKTLKVLFFYF